MILVLGAGLAGISCSYHLNHDCMVVEKNIYAGGHIFSHKINEFTWDEGPHVSFTKHQYVKDLFASSIENEFLEYTVYPINYYKGHWIPHPAQSNLYAVPEPLRSQCLSDFLESREQSKNSTPVNYGEWIKAAFGNKFSEEFVKSYTEKYWTVSPEKLTTDWVGGRVFSPDVETVKRGFNSPPKQSTHYITTVRYPKFGGYVSYAKKLIDGINISYCKQISKIDLEVKIVYFADGSAQPFTKLINTIPLPDFIKLIDADQEIIEAADDLACSQLLLLNYVVNHPAVVDAHWLYVYDLEKYSTRINFTELLSPNNGVPGKCGIQVEVYFSKYKEKNESTEIIINRVAAELIEMGLIKTLDCILEVNTQFINYANVIFDHNRRASLDKILTYLNKFGLQRELDDLDPMTDWDKKLNEVHNKESSGDIFLAGRFGQWKYYWTDDCVLRGKYISLILQK